MTATLHQHIDDAAGLYATRDGRLHAPDVGLMELRRLEDRLAANLEGIALAGDTGSALCEEALGAASAGIVFVITVQALVNHAADRLNNVLSVASAIPECRSGVAGGFAWVDKRALSGIVLPLTKASDPWHRVVGIDACAAQRVDPGAALLRWLEDPEPVVRAAAVRAGGQLGRLDLLPKIALAAADADPTCRHEANLAAVLLGDRNRALRSLIDPADGIDALHPQAFATVFQAMSVESALDVLRGMVRRGTAVRPAIRGSGLVGDPTLVPWLLKQMRMAATARVAGEAFTLITGADLTALGLTCDGHPDANAGPSDDPADDHVEMDDDDGLAWPNPELVQRWWDSNADRFNVGTRYFLGQAVDRGHCLAVLRHGSQRQRAVAARHLTLLEPGTPLFNTHAPARRQERWLASLAC